MYIRIVKMNVCFPHFTLFPFYDAKVTKQSSMSKTNYFKDLAFSNEPIVMLCMHQLYRMLFSPRNC